MLLLLSLPHRMTDWKTSQSLLWISCLLDEKYLGGYSDSRSHRKGMLEAASSLDYIKGRASLRCHNCTAGKKKRQSLGIVALRIKWSPMLSSSGQIYKTELDKKSSNVHGSNHRLKK